MLDYGLFNGLLDQTPGCTLSVYMLQEDARVLLTFEYNFRGFFAVSNFINGLLRPSSLFNFMRYQAAIIREVERGS